MQSDLTGIKYPYRCPNCGFLRKNWDSEVKHRCPNCKESYNSTIIYDDDPEIKFIQSYLGDFKNKGARGIVVAVIAIVTGVLIGKSEVIFHSDTPTIFWIAVSMITLISIFTLAGYFLFRKDLKLFKRTKNK